VNALDDPDAAREEASYLRARNALLRDEIARLRRSPDRMRGARSAATLRLVIAVLWVIGVASALFLAFALLALFSVGAAGGLKG
jgi:hypothetical protein